MSYKRDEEFITKNAKDYFPYQVMTCEILEALLMRERPEYEMDYHRQETMETFDFRMKHRDRSTFIKVEIEAGRWDGKNIPNNKRWPRGLSLVCRKMNTWGVWNIFLKVNADNLDAFPSELPSFFAVTYDYANKVAGPPKWVDNKFSQWDSDHTFRGIQHKDITNNPKEVTVDDWGIFLNMLDSFLK